MFIKLGVDMYDLNYVIVLKCLVEVGIMDDDIISLDMIGG